MSTSEDINFERLRQHQFQSYRLPGPISSLSGSSYRFSLPLSHCRRTLCLARKWNNWSSTTTGLLLTPDGNRAIETGLMTYRYRVPESYAHIYRLQRGFFVLWLILTLPRLVNGLLFRERPLGCQQAVHDSARAIEIDLHKHCPLYTDQYQITICLRFKTPGQALAPVEVNLTREEPPQ